MNLKIFTTSRQIRKWLEDKDNQFLDKYYTLGEFLNKLVVVDGKKFIDDKLRKKYLFEAIQDINVEKLGISKEFINFFDDSDFIFSFFNELFLEQTTIDKVLISDVYLDYSEHLEILKEILENYKKLLEKDGYIDKFLIEDFRINNGLLEGIEKIELVLDGYLTPFDLKILKKIQIPIEIEFIVDKFNKPLIEKSLKIAVDENMKYKLNFHNLQLEKISVETSIPNIDIAYFNDRLNQVNFVFAKIAQMIAKGISPENIAVILPDEEFSEYLKIFDEYNNLNFAMGESFTKSKLYITLKGLYDYLITEDEIAYKKCKDILNEYKEKTLIDFIKSIATNKELKVIDEELFKLESFNNMFKNREEFLYFILERLKEKSFDDIYSGKITCMGVLESRGVQFDGVILIDFNEDIVPRVSDSDMFLNSFIREQAKLPTRRDKENLQKHYYFQLIQNSKEVAISYVKNEEKAPSRFFYELGFGLGENGTEKYKEVIFKYSDKKEKADYSKEKFVVKEPIYPTILKTLMECSKNYYFSKILNITNKQETEDEFFGNIFHDAIKIVVDNKEKIENEDDYFNFLMEEIAIRVSDKELLFDIKVKWEDKIKEFCKQDFESMKYSTNKTEYYTDMSIDKEGFEFENKKLRAKIDRIDITEKEIILIDYKTSKSANETENYIYDFQTTFYFLWAKERFKNKNIKTIIWDIYNANKIEGVLKIDKLKEILNNLPNEVKEAEDIVYLSGKKEKIKKVMEICKYCDYKVACKGEL